MDAFEEIVAGLFRQNGFWTWPNYKINLTREQKREAENFSMPRPEIDILAYTPREKEITPRQNATPAQIPSNTLLWIECKSYLDSAGVRIGPVRNENGERAVKIRVFDDPNFRELAFNQLKTQAHDIGLIRANPSIQYGLVAGKIYPKTHSDLEAYFEQQGWLLFDGKWLRDELEKLAAPDFGYENDIAVIAAKLMLRQKG